ncbi:MAG: leucyl aminopeptidase [Xanthomonadales bacterium]|nr:leucyl aminopeptidase [Xanthomonadales bacterium]MDH3923485.1 leucyl aminopeptidase [Xanthomonadales bacterium]MDH3940662.1 leucyl aminopeptidase [Xanthomonadales bacterium]MDH4001400.1 leucyl aminopeptidase [Xanthomonadales bacterium]
MPKTIMALLMLVVFILAAPAHAMRAIGFAEYRLPAEGAIALPVTEDGTLSGIAAAVNEETGGSLKLALSEAKFTGKVGETLTLFGVRPYARIDVIGVGSETLDRVAAENFGGRVAALNDGSNGAPLNVLWQGVKRAPDANASRVALGFLLGDYRFDRYQQDRVDSALRGKVTFLGDDPSAADQYNNDLVHLASSVYLARDLAAEPANVIYPESFVERVRDAFKGLANVRIRVLDEKELAQQGMGAHLGVGQGSARPPRLLVVEYNGGADEPPLVLAGKGITFDSGGISLKGNDGMGRMKADMTGAAVVSATVLAAARRQAGTNLVALAALAENMPGSRATRPGDVLISMSGKTIEIKSTDAEGRLVLSDAVWYGQQEYSPDVLIDVATLTGSVSRAVGEGYSGLFSNNDALAGQLTAAARQAGEPTWRLPLDPLHYEQISSPIADVLNGSSGRAGASTGAAFIGSFIQPGQVWAHFDIAGVDFQEDPLPTVPKGYSGYGVRMLDQYIRDARSDGQAN